METKSAYLQTLESDWSSYKAGLAKESATCPVPQVTVQTMNECKKAMLALNRTDAEFIADLRNLDVPQELDPAISELSASLAALNEAHTTIIRRYIDKQDIEGFKKLSRPRKPARQRHHGQQRRDHSDHLARPECGPRGDHLHPAVVAWRLRSTTAAVPLRSFSAVVARLLGAENDL
jgi:hypothetical protein